MSPQEEAEELAGLGFRALEEEEFEEALRIGWKLSEFRHPSAFLIQALAYRKTRRIKEAVGTLNQGVREISDDWRLWNLLGELLVEVQRFDEAHESYRAALQCPKAPEAEIRLNIVHLQEAEENFSEAIQTLENFPKENPEYFFFSEIAKIRNLSRLRRHDEAVRIGEKWESNVPEELPKQIQASFWAWHGMAVLMGNQDKEKALQCAWKAVNLDKVEPSAIWLIRKIQGEVSENGKRFRLRIEGRWMENDQEGRPLEFYVDYWVIADSVEEAFDIVKQFEPKEVLDSLRIEEAKEMEACSDEPKGVCEVSSYIFWPCDEATS